MTSAFAGIPLLARIAVRTGWQIAVAWVAGLVSLFLVTGLSMAARAHRVSDRAEAENVIRMLPLQYPDAPPATTQLKMPAPEEIAIFRIVPEIICVLDYTQGFAHTDLVTC